jgi:hypothetical protein
MYKVVISGVFFSYNETDLLVATLFPYPVYGSMLFNEALVSDSLFFLKLL